VTAPLLGEPLDDPFAVPLAGMVAVEASAGTGKTFTITQLYVRLLLETGLTVGEILVVTYTKAATAELRGRLREKLGAVRGALETGTSEDVFCRGVLARTRDRAAAMHAIERALHGFDEAAVFTIHGFCQRVLTDRAFESGILFDTSLVPDERELVQEVVDDFWRRELYAASPGFVRWVLEQAGFTPDTLARLVRTHVGRSYRRIDAPDDPPGVVALETELAAAWEVVRGRWAADWPAVERLLCETPAIRRPGYKVDAIPSWGPAIAQMLADPVPDPCLLDVFERLTTTRVRERTKKGYAAPAHPLFDACDALSDAAARMREAYTARAAALRARLVREARGALAERKRERRVQSYDDLVSGLARALAHATRGPLLATALRSRYRAALIDEFQDTDPVQYEIVQRLYGGTELPVFLVGDPKQAIYGFRGADVFTYLEARRGARERRHLERNWRSAPRLITAVNALFGGAANPFVVEEIPFVPAVPADKAHAPLVVDGDADEPLRLWLVDEADAPNKDDQRAWAAAATAREIARLVGLGAVGRARLGDTALHGGHIAVLVRKNVEGRAMRERLLALGVPSVQQAVDSVFASREATELERVLLAIADPGQASLLRAALATEMLGVGGDDILALDEDERAWERRADAFHDYRHLWRTVGFAAMLRELMRREDVARRLLAFEDGERRLTNLLHLAELLQGAWLHAPGSIDALVEWLAEARRAAEVDEDEQQLRLESDERLVKIVTVHKSKGLEYPIVFCPFSWDGHLRADRDPEILFHEAQGDPRPTLDLGSAAIDARRPQARREELAEAVRLLYVAITRAEQRCYVVWGKLRDGGTSALAWLLHAPSDATGDAIDAVAAHYKGLSAAALRAELGALVARGAGAIRVEPTPRGVPPAPPARVAVATPATARRLAHPIAPAWEMTSFTRLVSGLDAERPDHDPTRGPALPPVGARDLFGFPRGARAGTCLHAVLEKVDYAADPAAWAPVARAALRVHGYEPDWEPVVLDMVARVVATPLDAAGAVRLARVPLAARVNELEFHHPLARIDGRRLGRLLLDHEFGTGPIRDAVARTRVESAAGFMKGFIDLVCACDGRYWLVDYKSNWLGDTLDDYAAERLVPVIAQETYWLQYLIYTVVVHRLLRRRLPDYDYDRHVGGVRYLFVRGMHPDRATATGVHQDRPSRALVEALDALLQPERS